MKIITIGNAVMDYYKDLNQMYPGGSALNVSVYSKRFGAEKSSFLGIIGTDAEGKHIERVLSQEKVDFTRLRKVVGKTSKVTITLNEDKDRIIGTWDKGVLSSVSIQLNKEDINFIESHDILHVGLNSFLDDELEALSQIISISYDFSTERREEHLNKVCPNLRYAFFSGSDLTINESKDLINYVHQLGTQFVFVTRGDKGAISSNSKSIYEQPIEKVEVKDTLGAGDSFVSMILTNMNHTDDLQEITKQATTVATKICNNLGAFGHVLTLEDENNKIRNR